WKSDERSLALFARTLIAPSDRNLINFSLNAGINVAAGDADTLGLGYGMGHVSGRAADLDRDTAAFTGTAYPIRGAEHFIEATYQRKLAGWWTVQPDLQYVINPGAGVPNPLNPAKRIGNELVLGLRTTVTF